MEIRKKRGGNTGTSQKQIHVVESEELPNQENSKDQAAEKIQAQEHTKKVPLCEDVPNRKVTIGTELSKEDKDRLIQFLRNNQDVFAWSKRDLLGGPPRHH